MGEWNYLNLTKFEILNNRILTHFKYINQKLKHNFFQEMIKRISYRTYSVRHSYSNSFPKTQKFFLP